MKPAILPLIAVVLGCGGSPPPEMSTPPGGEPTLRMRHQILFSRGEDVQVFEGYMLSRGDAFIVKAFAGPGVDLFTVVRDGSRKNATLHIASLSDRIDIARVGEDIGRVYLNGCEAPDPPPAGERSCRFYGEPLVEVRDADGRLTSRRFPEAHGIGLNVTYEDYSPYGDRLLPKRITLTWGTSSNRMIIRLVEATTTDVFPADELERALSR
jgi:hypothetical protein